MIIIIGISHIEKLDRQLEKIIYDFKPEALCVELDEINYKFLTNKLTEEKIRLYYADMPFIFKMLSMYTSKSHDDSAVEIMWDSRVAYKISKKLGFKILPIDIDKKKLYSDMNKNMGLREKMRISFNVLKYIIFPSKKFKESDDYEKRFPTLKKFLIDKKNQYISEEIKKNSQIYKKMIVLVGDNHLKFLKNLDLKDDVKIIDFESLKIISV